MIELLQHIVNTEHPVINNTFYCHKESDLYPFNLLTKYWFFKPVPGGYDFTEVDPSTIIKRMDEIDYVAPIMLDLEHWNPFMEQYQMQTNMKTVLELYQMNTDDLTGMYSMIPYRNHSEVVFLKRAIEANDQITIRKCMDQLKNFNLTDMQNAEALLKYVDVLYPSIYVTYNTEQGIEEWKWYATYAIMQANRIAQGKLVMPVLWWCAISDKKVLSEENWTKVIKYIKTLHGVDGIMIYAGDPEPDYDWTKEM